MTVEPRPRVALVGAYERDNFGDLLFLELTRDGLHGCDTVATSIVGADMRAIDGAVVAPAGVALARSRFDAVWVVGGEVGTATVANALALSLPDDERQELERSVPEDRMRLERFLTGGWPSPAAYVPVLADFPPNAATPLAINSVGISAIGRQSKEQAAQFLRAFVQPAAVAVRDRASSVVLSDAQVPHSLEPDLVHGIRHNALPDSPIEPGSVLVQATVRYLEAIGPDAFAEAVADIAGNGRRITLFAAGTAHRHDSFAAYDVVASAIAARRPGADVMVLRERRPLQLAAAIRDAALWVGTSLHGRIVASAFDVPRVSLENAKVAGYAATWDPVMPSAVTSAGLADAVEVALRSAVRRDASVGAELADRAARSLERMRNDVGLG